jgi:aminomethyltransferase
MPRHTALYDAHIASGGRMVDFTGWDMPINYGSQIEEHHHVRTHSGMFDVSHMTVVDIRGGGCRDFLSCLLANDVAKLHTPGEEWFRLVVNAATRDKGLAWLEKQAFDFNVAVTEHHELAMIAVQGPEARDKVLSLMSPGHAADARTLKPFTSAHYDDLFIARTGYTGEDGFEVSLLNTVAGEFWNRLLEAGVKPCGLGARDTLRLEAGMNLYGQDMDESVTPLESALSWTVAMKDDRQFIGRAALEAQKAAGVQQRLVGLVLQARGVLRPGQTIITTEGSGITTSGSFSPTLQRSIAFARIPAGEATTCKVEIRGKQLECKIVRPPFVRNGVACDGIV